jgi:hypothetical protein
METSDQIASKEKYAFTKINKDVFVFKSFIQPNGQDMYIY